MPILWGYLLKYYFKFFFLCIGSFVSLLLVMRAQEIARFATLNSNGTQILWFTLCQLPYILPFAIPISGLIASTILTQTLSQTHELTALRACGASVYTLITPVMISALFLGLLNFFIISEMGPYCKLQSISLVHKSVTDHPLMLFRKNKFLSVKNTVVDMALMQGSDRVKNFLFAFLDPSSRKLSLINAQELYLEQGLVKGSSLAMISSLESRNDFDDLLIENQKEMSIDAAQLSSLLHSSHRRVRYEHLPTKLCLVKMQLDAPARKTTTKGLFELYKRLFFTLAPITFICLGTCFGMHIGRNSSRGPLISISILTILLFLGYILGKNLHHKPVLALLSYLLPQALVYILCLSSIQKLQKGTE